LYESSIVTSIHSIVLSSWRCSRCMQAYIDAGSLVSPCTDGFFTLNSDGSYHPDSWQPVAPGMACFRGAYISAHGSDGSSQSASDLCAPCSRNAQSLRSSSSTASVSRTHTVVALSETRTAAPAPSSAPHLPVVPCTADMSAVAPSVGPGSRCSPFPGGPPLVCARSTLQLVRFALASHLSPLFQRSMQKAAATVCHSLSNCFWAINSAGSACERRPYLPLH
jgi:hypothetical protein